MGNRIAGTIAIQVNGEVYDAVGAFTYNLGAPKREMLVGADRVHGYKEQPQIPFIEGEFRDSSSIDLGVLTSIVDATVTVKLANGKTFMLRNACWASEGDVETEEAKIKVRFEGMSGEEIPA